MARSDPEELVAAIMTASRALVAVAARSLAAAGEDITLPQYRALVVLAARGPRRVSDLADAIGIHPSTATRLCDRLARHAWISRRMDEDNRREIEVALTPKGRALVDRVSEVRRAEIRSIVRRIPNELRTPALDALHAVSEAAGELPDEAWTLGW